jgi:DNA helicase HerA-like ATPase
MKIGKIISVEFDKFRVKLFHTTRTSTVSIEGKVYYFGNIGSYLKAENSVGDIIICEVVSVLDNSMESKPYTNFNLDSSRELIIKPIGTLQKCRVFNMGVGIFPSIYSDVLIVTENDIQDILETKDKTSKDVRVHNEITIGTSKSLINYSVKVNINRFFNIHTAVIGNSGSGKSNTISHILQQVLRKTKNAGIGIKVVVFDVNGEYKKAFEEEKTKGITTIFYKPNINKGFTQFCLPYYLMNLDEWAAFLMATDRTQKPFWDKVLQECYKFYKIKTGTKKEREIFINYFKFKLYNILNFIFSRVDSDTANVTSAASAIRKIRAILSGTNFKPSIELEAFVDEMDLILKHCILSYGIKDPKLLSVINDLSAGIDYDKAYSIQEQKLRHGNYYDYQFLSVASEMILLEEGAKGNSRIGENTATMLSRLEYFLNNSDCNFMKSGDHVYTSEEDYLEKIFGISEKNKVNQLVILDSSEVSRDILELLTSVVNRLIFDYRKKKVGNARRQNPVHIILDEAHRYIKKDTEYLMKENIFEKIAREGRKFSMYLIVSSQRPSELSQTVLSQCGNYIIHRIQNEVDMNYIYSVLPYFSVDYITRIKQSTPGEALIFGNCVPMPLSVKVEQANPEPNSDNCIINEEWYKE